MHAVIRWNALICRDEVRQNTVRLPTKVVYDGCGSSGSRIWHGVADVGNADAPAHPRPSALIAERNLPPVTARTCNRRSVSVGRPCLIGADRSEQVLGAG